MLKRSKKKTAVKKVKKVKKKPKVIKKKTSRKPKRIPSKPPVMSKSETAAMDQEIAVWGAYTELQSIAMVAERLGLTVHRVRQTLSYDWERLERIKQDNMELAAARWEIKRNEALDLMGRTLKMYLGDLLAIEDAVKKGRTLTTIRGEDGIELPVLGARELMMKSRMMDQFIKLAAQAESTSSALRAGFVPSAGGGGDGGGEAQIPTDFSKYNDLQLVQMIEAAGDAAPESLKLKAAAILKARKQAQDELDK